MPGPLPPPPPPPRTTRAALLREYAVAAGADPRTVLRVLRGENVLGMVGIRIRRVLAAHGIVVPERSIVELARPQIGVDRTKVRL